MKEKPGSIGVRISLLLGCIIISSLACGQPVKETYNVGIFLYQGTELLDFAGPGEVFGSSRGFKVYTVSVDGEPITSQRFVTIDPQYSLSDVPPTDILIFPGGSSSPSANDPRVLNWIKSSYSSGAAVLSVCTGAEILAKAGLLENLNVTTFHGFIPGLQSMLPNSKVLKDTRYVDNGNIITTAGVSAGIDGALHLLARIKGLDVAKSTARYMEYDKWEPNEGKVDYTNPNISKILSASTQPEKNLNTTAILSGDNIPYEGEFKNLAADLRDKGEIQQASRVLELAVSYYPHSPSIYTELGSLYKKLGKPKPLDIEELVEMVRSGKGDKIQAIIEKDRKNFPNWNLTSEEAINLAAYRLMGNNELANAIEVFELNTRLYPLSANVFDSLGEGYRAIGNTKEAVANYKKSLQLDPGNTNAKNVLKELGEKI